MSFKFIVIPLLKLLSFRWWLLAIHFIFWQIIFTGQFIYLWHPFIFWEIVFTWQFIYPLAMCFNGRLMICVLMVFWSYVHSEWALIYISCVFLYCGMRLYYCCHLLRLWVFPISDLPSILSLGISFHSWAFISIHWFVLCVMSFLLTVRVRISACIVQICELFGILFLGAFAQMRVFDSAFI